MKKLILPALISIITLTSCSQALYKNKYDWVKAERVESRPLRDSLVAHADNLNTSLLEMASSILETIEQKMADTMIVPDSTVAAAQRYESAESDSGSGDVFVKRNAIMTRELKTTERVQAPSKRGNFLKNVDWFEVIYNVVFWGGLLVLYIFRDNPTVQIIIAVLELLSAIAALVAFVIAIIWVCRIFTAFLFMMDN